jgi:hypothetical protein
VSDGALEDIYSVRRQYTNISIGRDRILNSVRRQHTTVDGGNLGPLYEIASSDSIVWYSSISSDTKY